MFNPVDTFPYIGLRPFSEDDSLYFKGRDEQILQLTALLEVNKFLMVTGASGDGKSSLVYAGLVPNARAGFFKAKYANWVVADFRPERTPLVNLSKAISRNLRIGNEESVEVELRRGFSSLVELYTTSSLYLDEESEEWSKAGEVEREDKQRKAANLLIVADQFEEFFTNPENYYKNAPSADSQLVINLLLETARIAIAKNLPIYIVCTMRSDYIGQCAAFRGLPEFIGFSQFFVPRLKRKEMIQVVKEPAFLHGDTITNRLAERVVYDLGEGIDQLPVLEHAMNEVWIQAKHGQETLDLIHYAMAGGMPPRELPVEDRKGFETWFSTLPPKLQDAYQRPGLSHIIDTHANKLYLSAADHYNERHEKKITNADAQLIIKVAFICLTKMDEGRAVRNRMTLQEITDIISRPHLTTEVAGGVLNIFRETGNTFLRPYITDDPETHQLKPESVLDITHESLIRNWELLLTWAQDEYDHLTVYEDFKKQLDRWLGSNRSKGFLLPIGPLTFFEDWHDTLKPNRYWVNRYLDPGVDKETRLQQAQQIVEDTREFLDRSAKRVRVTRLVVKYGASRIAAVIGSIVILALCGFYYRDAQVKQNKYVVRNILKEGIQYITDPLFETSVKADFLISKEFMEPGSFKRAMDAVPFEQQFDIIRDVYGNFLLYGGSPGLKRACLYYGDSVIVNIPVQEKNPVFLMDYLRALNVMLMTTSHYLYNQQDERIASAKRNALEKTRTILLNVFDEGYELSALDMAVINDGIDNALNNNTLSSDEVRQMLALISPFEGPAATENFNRYFPVDNQVRVNRRDNFMHNGGYQQLAYLYGYLGQVETVKACVDSLLKYHRNYLRFRTNVLNISTYLFKGGYAQECDELLSYYAQRQNVSKKELYEQWLDISGIRDRLLAFKIHYRENHNPNIELMDYELVNALFDQYYSVIQREYSSANDFNFNLALYYKHRGIILAKIDADKHGKYNSNPDELFAKALEHYRSIAKEYLEQPIDASVQDLNFGLQRLVQKRRRAELFAYPDHFPKVRNDRLVPPRYFSDTFISFLLKSNAFNDLFTTGQDLELLNEWLQRYDRETAINWDYRIMRDFTPPSEMILVSIDSIFASHPAAKQVNASRTRMILMDRYINQDEVEKVNALYERLDLNRMKEIFRSGGNIDKHSFSHKIYRLAEYFALKGRKEDAIQLVRIHSNPMNFIRVYATISQKLLKSDQPGPKGDAYIYLDSAITEFERIKDFFFTSSDPRVAIVLTPALIGGKDMNDLSLYYVRSINMGEQSGVVQNLIIGTAMRGDLYEAYTAIPEMARVERLFYFNLILASAGLAESTDPAWSAYFDAFQNYWIWEVIGYEADIL